MTHDEAMLTFARLVRQWGLQWTAAMNIPRSDWDLMAEAQKLLTSEDRWQAIR